MDVTIQTTCERAGISKKFLMILKIMFSSHNSIKKFRKLGNSEYKGGRNRFN